jgi:hypothetical protein
LELTLLKRIPSRRLLRFDKQKRTFDLLPLERINQPNRSDYQTCHRQREIKNGISAILLLTSPVDLRLGNVFGNREPLQVRRSIITAACQRLPVVNVIPRPAIRVSSFVHELLAHRSGARRRMDIARRAVFNHVYVLTKAVTAYRLNAASR